MKLGKSIIVMMTAVAAMVGNAGESAEFRLDTKDGPRIARAVETIAYSTEWSDGSTVSVAVDGVVIKDATAPASGDVIWNAAQAGAGRHTLTHTSGGVTMTAVFEADLCYALRFAANASDATGTMLDMSVAYGDSASLPVCAFEREGYFFVGWSTSSNVNAAVHFDTETMKFNYDSMGVYRPGDTWCIGDESFFPDGVTLYAIWAKNYIVKLRHNTQLSDSSDDVIVSLGLGDVLPRNTFDNSSSGRENVFIGWTTLQHSSGKFYRYQDCSPWDGAGERIGGEVVLYAIWIRPVKYCFYNNEQNGKTLEPQGLEKLVKWHCKSWKSPWHDRNVPDEGVDRSVYEWHDGSETVCLPPGDYEIEFSVENEGTPWVDVEPLRNGDKLSIPIINGGVDDSWTIFRYFNLLREDDVMVKFGYTLVYSGEMKKRFDSSRVRIMIRESSSSYDVSFDVKADSTVPLRMNKRYEAEFSYDGNDFEWRGKTVAFTPRDLCPNKREVIGNFYSDWGGESGSGRFSIALFLPDGQNSSLEGTIGDRIYLPQLTDEGQRKFLGWYADLLLGWEKVDDGTLVTQAFLNKINNKLYAKWDESILEIAGGWLSRVSKTVGMAAVSVLLPSSVVGIQASAFAGCEDVEAVVFEGDAPEVESGAFDGLQPDCVFYVSPASAGWGVNIPGTWNGHRIEYVDLPDTTHPVFDIEDGELSAVDLNGATEVTIPDGVTSISDGAFGALADLLSVTIPSSVTNIHAWAFDGCGELTSIAVAEGNTCYKSVNGLLLSKDGTRLVQGVNGDVVVPSGVTCICDSAFFGCCNLTGVTIPNGVTDIEDYAFGNCSRLTSVSIPADVTSIGYKAFDGCGDLTSVTFVGNAPDFGTDALCCYYDEEEGYYYGVNPECVVYVGTDSTGWGVDIPGTWNGLRIEYVADGPGDGQTPYGTPILIRNSPLDYGELVAVDPNGATDVVIPGDVTRILSFAFTNCVGVKSVTMLDGVAKLSWFALQGCSNLVSVTIPASLTDIGFGAFDGCVSLRSFEVASGNPSYKSENGLLLTKDGKSLCNGVNGDVTIPNGVTDIWDFAFYGCGGLTSVAIPDGLTDIGLAAFGHCIGLKSVAIPKSVTNIDDGAFCGCVNLVSVLMPRIKYDPSVFEDCSPNLKISYWDAPASHKLTLKSSNTKYGTVTGGGTYDVGSQVTIKAKAKKGDVFAGWFKDKSCKKPLNPEGYDNRSPTVEMTMPAKNMTVYAKFVTKAADKKALKFSSVTKKLAKTPAKATAGKALSLKLGISSASLPTVTAKGLPKGLSIDKTTGVITGTATKPGSCTATVTVKDAAGNKITQKVKITVSVASWAKGTFYGTAKPGKKASDPAAYLQFTVGSTGKVSGKVTYKGKKYSFTSSYSSCAADKAKFSPNVKIGSYTFKPKTVTVKTVKMDGLSVVEAANAKGTFAAQKKPNLVKKGKKLAKLVGKKFTFTKKDKNSGLAKSKDKLAVTVSNGDAVKVSGTVNGKKLSASLPLLVSSKATKGGVTTYTLYVDIIEPTLKYVRTLVFTATVGPDGVAVNAAFAK